MNEEIKKAWNEMHEADKEILLTSIGRILVLPFAYKLWRKRGASKFEAWAIIGILTELGSLNSRLRYIEKKYLRTK